MYEKAIQKKKISKKYFQWLCNQKMLSTFHKTYLKKLIGILAPLNSTLSMAKPIVKLSTKWKWGYQAKNTTKYIKK